MKKYVHTLLMLIIFTSCSKSIQKEAFTLEDSDGMLYMGIYNNADGISTEAVGNQIQNSMVNLMKFYKENDYSFDPVSGSFMLNLKSRGESVNFLPFSKKEKTPKNTYGIKLGQTFRGNSLLGIHLGSYSSVEETYKKMFKYIEEKGWTNLGYATEIYLTDPAVEKDPKKWETEIRIAIETKKHGDIEVSTLPRISYASLRKQVAKTESLSIEETMGQQMYLMNNQIMDACHNSDLHPPYVTGFNIIHNRTNEQADFEFCVPVPIKTDSDELVEFSTLKPVKALKIVHFGNYDFSKTYKDAYTYAVANGLELDSKSYEFYMNDPRKQEDPSTNVTHIYIPIIQQ